MVCTILLFLVVDEDQVDIFADEDDIIVIDQLVRVCFNFEMASLNKSTSSIKSKTYFHSSVKIKCNKYF